MRTRGDINKLLMDSVQEADRQSYAVVLADDQTLELIKSGSLDALSAQFERDFGAGIGISVCGGVDENEKFVYDYYYPYLRPTGVSTAEEVTVERHASEDSYAGACEELRVGVTMIFYVINKTEWLRNSINSPHVPPGTTISLSALSIEGTIILPLAKTAREKDNMRRMSLARSNVIAAAKEGNEEAMDIISCYDYNTYNVLQRKGREADIYTLVDTSFAPYGVECDQYSVVGEIVEVRMTTNFLTKEEIYILRVVSNYLMLDIAINKEDLYGEPAVGRRFKGTIWLQGYLNFPNQNETEEDEGD